MEEFAIDAKTYIEKIREIYSGLQIFVLGESMGGFVAAYLSTIAPELAGIILLAPALGVNEDYEKCIRRMLKVLGRVWPGLRLKRANLNEMSRNVHFESWANEDPLVFHEKINARSGLSILKSLQGVKNWIHNVKIPFFVIQGGDEMSVDKDLSIQFYTNSEVQEKRLIFIEEMKHFISCEPNFPELLEEIVRWVNERI